MPTTEFTEAEIRPWDRVDPPIWWPKANAYVIGDRHLPDGTRQHIIQGHAVAGLVIANAQVFGDKDSFHGHSVIKPPPL